MTLPDSGSRLYLDALTMEDCEIAREWRNRVPMATRTAIQLTAEMQQRFYEGVVCDRRSTHRYWAVRRSADRDADSIVSPPMVAMAGLTDIEFENGIAEISLIADPSLLPRQGIGDGAVHLVLEEAFDRMRLETVYGECYENNPAVSFWRWIIERYRGHSTILPRRKFFAGKLHDSYYFTITALGWRAADARSSHDEHSAG